MSPLIVFVLAVVSTLIISFICSLSEATLLSLTPAQIAEISQKNPRLGDAWKRFKDNIDKPISAILTLNTSAHTIGATVAGAEFDALFGDRWIWLFSLAFTFLMLQYTEILPKTLGVRFNNRLALWMFKPLSRAIWVLTPVIVLVRLINSPFEPKASEDERERTLDDLILMTALARQTQKIGRQQERIIVETTKLSEKTARDVMIPMKDVRLLSTSMKMVDILNPERHDSHTRYPVYENNDPDDVIGYVNVKEVVSSLRNDKEFGSLVEILREVHFVPPEEPISRLLLAFTSRREHLAVVRTEQGRCLGIITLEDIVEELLGELEDEFDHLPNEIRRDHEKEDIWIVGGGVTIGELYSTLLQPLDDQTDPNRPLADWLEDRIDGTVREGTTLAKGALIFTIRRICRHHIAEAFVEVKDDE